MNGKNCPETPKHGKDKTMILHNYFGGLGIGMKGSRMFKTHGKGCILLPGRSAIAALSTEPESPQS